MPAPRARLTVLVTTFEPVVLHPYCTLWNGLVGSKWSQNLWKLVKRFAAFWFCCYVAGASCLFYSLTSEQVPVDEGKAVITLFELFGLLSTILCIGFFNSSTLFRILRYTFEGAYVTFLVVLMSISSTIFLRLAFIESLVIIGSLTFVLYIDAAPPAMQQNKLTYLSFLFGALYQFACVQYYLWANDSRSRVLESERIDIPTIGYVSLFQRFVLTPCSTSSLFFFKYLIQKYRFPKRSVLIYSRIEERTFKDLQALDVFLEEQNNRFLASALQHFQNRRDNSKLRMYRASFRSLIIDTRNDTIMTWLFGQRASQKLRAALKNFGVLYSVVVTLLSLLSSGAIVLVFADLLPVFMMPFASIFIAAAQLSNVILGNKAKAKLLLFSFEPVYLTCVSLCLSFGLCLTLQDIRAFFLIPVLVGSIGNSLFDAQSKRSRAKSGGTIFFVAVLFDLSLMAVFYFGYISNITIYRFTFPGSGKRISSIQAFVVTPLACLIPYHTRMLLLWLYNPQGLLTLKSHLKMHSFDSVKEAEAELCSRKKSLMQSVRDTVTLINPPELGLVTNRLNPIPICKIHPQPQPLPDLIIP